MNRPIIFLDVDGVIAPWFKPEYGVWLRRFEEVAELVWATNGWRDTANSEISPLYDLPELPKIEYDKGHKLSAIRSFAGSRPACFIDDKHAKDPNVIVWAQEREHHGIPTLLIAPNPNEGLEEWHVNAVERWIARL